MKNENVMPDRQTTVGDVLVHTPNGALLGETIGSRGDVQVFKGIPYAVPPVGSRRWKAPEPIPAWSGIRRAKEFGPHAMQPFMPYDDILSPEYYARAFVSEDCLYLNVWTAGKAGDKRPVMVWIPGGGFAVGGGSEISCDGAALARKGVVLVTLNYRVGIFGYFAHPELTAESAHRASGNYGALDQIEALRWVQANIAAFGGDPNNVTIFGCSAGARSVGYLMASPLSKGLFHRAIAESGAYLFPLRELDRPKFGVESAHDMGIRFARMVSAKSLAELRELPAEALIDAAGTAQDMWGLYSEPTFRPEAVVDGWVFPEQIYDVFQRGGQHDVPVILGFNQDEASSFVYSNQVAPVPADNASYEAEVRKRYGELTNQYFELYPAADLVESVFRATRDGVYAWALETWARACAQTSSHAYIYLFAHDSPEAEQRIEVPGSTGWEKRRGVYHGSEVPYAFNNVSLVYSEERLSETDKKMADLVSDLWVAFARNGVPHSGRHPEWRPYSLPEKHYLEFRNGEAHVKKELTHRAWKLYDQVYRQRRETDTGGALWHYMGGTGLLSPALDLV